jgi:intracellular multiplication protein IcmV
MAILKKGFQAAGGVLKSIVDVKSWLGYDFLKYSSVSLFGSIRESFSPRKPTLYETFDEAIARLNLSEEDITTIKARLLRNALIYLCCATLLFSYMLYLFWNGLLLAGFISFFVVLLFCVKALEAHFHSFQMKQRKLGCSLKEWAHSFLTHGVHHEDKK